jgi:hypothetical protein
MTRIKNWEIECCNFWLSWGGEGGRLPWVPPTSSVESCRKQFSLGGKSRVLRQKFSTSRACAAQDSQTYMGDAMVMKAHSGGPVAVERLKHQICMSL